MENNGLKYFGESLYLSFGLFNKVTNSENSASFTKKDVSIMKLDLIKKGSAPFLKYRIDIPLGMSFLSDIIY